ncbi:MAG: hypothetical protein KGN76_09855 [Acidobacteriota bacterium]|nr:hypothetical protein [Acidobacteriota bacterium]
MRRTLLVASLPVLAAIWLGALDPAARLADRPFRFAVSGDSRNCGDVVMPAIAAGVRQQGAGFYWHLGDFRAIYTFDEDVTHQLAHQAQPLTIIQYENTVWDDFVRSQIDPFGTRPVFLGIGNHENIPPKTRSDYLEQFADWLGQPVLTAQRLQDDPRAHRLRTYFHWIDHGVDFISMDNASPDQFDAAQLTWVKAVIARDEADPAVRAIVLGAHRALPESISADHSMNESPQMRESGRQVYEALLHAQNAAGKHVYLLASHSHYYMENTFNTPYWREHGGVLPGWIVGTAGAVRYPLPADAHDAAAAETNVYGYLTGTVADDGQIAFAFHRIAEAEVPPNTAAQFTPGFVHWCFAENSLARPAH